MCNSLCTKYFFFVDGCLRANIPTKFLGSLNRRNIIGGGGMLVGNADNGSGAINHATSHFARYLWPHATREEGGMGMGACRLASEVVTDATRDRGECRQRILRIATSTDPERGKIMPKTLFPWHQSRPPSPPWGSWRIARKVTHRTAATATLLEPPAKNRHYVKDGWEARSPLPS